MPPTPNQIRELLLKSIDKDSNVVDMGNVTKAITFLEKSQITKEALEATRLGKLINDIRKKTTDKGLSARCKGLIKQWQKFVLSAQKKDPAANTTTAGAVQTDGTGASNLQCDTAATGSRPPSRRTPQSKTTSSVDKSRKENRKRRRPNTPGSTSSSPSSELAHPAKRIAQVSSTAPDSTDSSVNGLPNQVTPKTASKKRNRSPKGGLKSASAKSSSDNVANKKAKAGKVASDEKSSSLPSPSGESKVANKSSRNSSPVDPSKRTTLNQKHSPNLSIPKVSKVSKRAAASPSAAATLQLSKTATKSNSDSKISAKLPHSSTQNSALGSLSPGVRPNSRGVEDGNSSVATVKLRTSQENCAVNSPSMDLKNVPSTSIKTQNYASTAEVVKSVNRTEAAKKTLKPAKSIFDDDSSEEEELVQTEITDPTNLQNTFSLESPTYGTPEIQESDEETNVIDENSAIIAESSASIIASNGEKFVPKITPTYDEFPSSSGVDHETLEDDEEEVVVKKPVTAEDVKRLHNDKWEGVNGCYDNKGEWFDWTQCLSVLFNEEEHPLHILPYVSLD